MTEKEQHDYMNAMLTGHHEDSTHNHYADVHTALQVILSEIKSRRCENCVHYVDDWEEEGEMICALHEIAFVKTFACNEHERKVNDN